MCAHCLDVLFGCDSFSVPDRGGTILLLNLEMYDKTEIHPVNGKETVLNGGILSSWLGGAITRCHLLQHSNMVFVALDNF